MSSIAMPVNHATTPAPSAGSPTSSSSTTAASNSLGGSTDTMFMQLLITQLQNQDPTSPMDPSTFVTQLVEVNNLDQVSQINQLLQSKLGS
jgi:flagellar basal-body rod modification protein FlgD